MDKYSLIIKVTFNHCKKNFNSLMTQGKLPGFYQIYMNKLFIFSNMSLYFIDPEQLSLWSKHESSCLPLTG